MAVDIKQAHRQLLEEAFGKGRLDAFDEICDRGFKTHDPVAGDADLRKAKQDCATYRSAFPDLRCTILAQVLDGDTVVTHWRMSGTHDGTLMGIEPTGARCTVEGISLGRFRGGKLVEDWVQWDGLGLMRQLGVGMGAPSRASEVHPQI
jgi:predicted ester cyclase